MTTKALAEFASALQYKDLPSATMQKAKCLLLDGIGCLLAGTKAGPALSASSFINALECRSPQATIYIGKRSGTVRDAAFVNAMGLYSIGLNDIHKASISHPGACVIPVVLALSEWKKIAGGEMIAAMAAGYEVMARVGRSVIPSHRERGFHATGTFGTFGAATAAARLLAYDAAQTANTLGIAGSQAAGLFEFHRDGTLTMIFHAARAAQNGVEAAMLSAEGLTGPTTVLEGSRGFCRATSNAFNEAVLTHDLGRSYELDATSFRPYYGCSSTIPGTGAISNVMQMLEGCTAESISGVVVRCNPVVAHDNADQNPTTLLGARLSMPFNLSLVLAQGHVHVADVTEEHLHDPRIRANLNKVRLEADAAMPRFGSSVTVKLKDGRIAESTVRESLGDPGTPLAWDAVVEKFQLLTRGVIQASAVASIGNTVQNIEKSDGAQLAGALRQALIA